MAKDDRRLVAEEYRQLRLNYESNRQEAEAGAFYIGQMEMRRRDKPNSESTDGPGWRA